MQVPVIVQQQQFVTAFVSCTLDSKLQYAPYALHSNHYFITDIMLVQNNYQCSNSDAQMFPLDGTYSLLLSRNHNQKPIFDIANFQQVPQGWDTVRIQKSINVQLKSFICFKRGSVDENIKCIYSLQLVEPIYQDKIEETTQPSFSQNSQIIHSYVKLQFNETKKYLSFSKRSQIQLDSLRFKSQIQVLFQRKKGEVDLPNSVILCFPEGVRIFKKQTGFKFFSFIITTDRAQRYYCNSIIFSQKCSSQICSKLNKIYGAKNQRGFFKQKVFTLISKYNCTDHTNQCLQYLYRIYLSQSYQNFTKQIENLQHSFIIDTSTKKSKFQAQNFGLNFKINSSYPQTSIQAIYVVFKFLQIQNIVTVIQNILLERKIFIISDCENIVGLAIQAFLSFIYPLNWVHAIINPCSSSMIQYTQAPMTIVFGMKNSLVSKIKSSVDGLFVYLDYNKIQLKNNNQICFMPNLRKQLIERLRNYTVYDKIDVRDYLDNPQNLSLFKTQKTQDPHFDVYKIRNIFFQLTVFMLRNYQQYFHKKFKKDQPNIEGFQGSFKNYYDLPALLNLYRKDPFMEAFFQTTLFSVLIQKKYEQPKNKWIKNLDRAIKKIAEQTKKYYIQQQSDNHSDTNEQLQISEPPQLMPKGCLNILSFTTKSSDQEKSKSSPSPKKYAQDQKYNTPTSLKVHGRMSLPNQYQVRQVSNVKNNKYEKRLSSLGSNQDRTSQKQSKQTDRGSQSNGKSQTSIPSIDQNNQVIVYQFDVQNLNQKEDQSNQEKDKKLGSMFCSILSYPYKKMSNSVVSRWTKNTINKLKSWKKNKRPTNITNNCDGTISKDTNNGNQQQPKIKIQQAQKKLE